MISLPPQELKARLKSSADKINQFLASYLDNWPDTPERLKKAMLYSLQAGGKRLRPALCLAWASLCNLDAAKALPFAAAIEMIHTYSLIHDDLPAMDDDDLRRGKPSCHKQFDEATAILAGDGLLTDAFFIMGKTDLPAGRVLAALLCIAEAAGSGGMVGGQMLDMEYTGQSGVTLKQVEKMQALKTGAMLQAACLSGALLAGASEVQLKSASEYGAALGKAFQIADDILDIVGDPGQLGKPTGSDIASGKNTFPSLAGLEMSRKLARQEADRAIAALPDCDCQDGAFLAGLADYAVARSS